MCQVIWMPVTRYPGQCCLSRDCLAIRNMGRTIGIPVCYAILMRCPLGAIMNPELVISRGFFLLWLMDNLRVYGHNCIMQKGWHPVC